MMYFSVRFLCNLPTKCILWITAYYFKVWNNSLANHLVFNTYLTHQTCVRHHKQQQVVHRLFVIIYPYQWENKKKTVIRFRWSGPFIKVYDHTNSIMQIICKDDDDIFVLYQNISTIVWTFLQIDNFVSPWGMSQALFIAQPLKVCKKWKSEICSIKWWRLKSVNLTL